MTYHNASNPNNIGVGDLVYCNNSNYYEVSRNTLYEVVSIAINHNDVVLIRVKRAHETGYALNNWYKASNFRLNERAQMTNLIAATEGQVKKVKKIPKFVLIDGYKFLGTFNDRENLNRQIELSLIGNPKAELSVYTYTETASAPPMQIIYSNKYVEDEPVEVVVEEVK